jgi:alpha(1,3/1,4) fucosyltransferase
MRIWFTDFWKEFLECNFIVNTLNGFHIPFTLDKENPDIIFSSLMGKEHEKYSCPRVVISAECSTTKIDGDKLYTETYHPFCEYKPTVSDYVISSQHSISPKHLRFPTYAVQLDYIRHSHPNHYSSVYKEKFCSFFGGHLGKNAERYYTLQKLSEYKKVDVGANHLNSIISRTFVNFIHQEWKGNRVFEKLKLTANYRFSLGMEHTILDGYITEKLVDGMLVGSIPIYSGPDITTEFPGLGYVKVDEHLLDRVRELDARPDEMDAFAVTNEILAERKLIEFQINFREWFTRNFL